MNTVVLGASANTERYSNKAVKSLIQHGHQVYPVGNSRGDIDGLPILNDFPLLTDIDTVTLYLNPSRQADIMDYVFSLHPRRIIFNPGTENPIFETKANEMGIITMEACTLVLLSIGAYEK
jgi:predicted CoA-binding protein